MKLIAVKRVPTWYVPDFRNNRSIATADPDQALMVQLTPMTSTEYQAMRDARTANGVRKIGDLFGGEREIRNAVISKNVHQIKNCEIGLDDGSTLTPSNGAQLVDIFTRHLDPTMAEELLNDIREAIVDSSTLSEGIVKKSPS